MADKYANQETLFKNSLHISFTDIKKIISSAAGNKINTNIKNLARDKTIGHFALDFIKNTDTDFKYKSYMVMYFTNPVLDINITDSNGNNVMHAAILCDAFEIAACILNNKNLNINARNNLNQTYLYIALSHKKFNIAHILLKNTGLKIDYTFTKNMTYFHIAATNNVTPYTLKKLIECFIAEINRINSVGYQNDSTVNTYNKLVDNNVNTNSKLVDNNVNTNSKLVENTVNTNNKLSESTDSIKTNKKNKSIDFYINKKDNSGFNVIDYLIYNSSHDYYDIIDYIITLGGQINTNNIIQLIKISAENNNVKLLQLIYNNINTYPDISMFDKCSYDCYKIISKCAIEKLIRDKQAMEDSPYPGVNYLRAFQAEGFVIDTESIKTWLELINNFLEKCK